ncbi:MAG TPA: HepT-like ribonuclease domain-containing protein [Stellaceae bacterium]|nr:HepT-like ribonuclease domain-containing protein [Stellaceae bacterium]
MSSDDPKHWLRGMLEAIERIRRHVRGFTAQRFAADEKTQDAIERCLERLSEAARKLGDALDAKYPEVEFKKLRQLGSMLRHDCDEVDPALIWRTIAHRLDLLEAACRKELKSG